MTSNRGNPRIKLLGTMEIDIPSCDSCDKPALLEQAYSGRVLCGQHLVKSIRKKIARELRKQLKLVKGEHTTIFVAISGGKDSAVLMHIARKAFYPAKLPFPVMHVDTNWKFKEMISFRDQKAKEWELELIVHKNLDGLKIIIF